MDRAIKVAYVIGGLPFGGVENWLYDLAVRFEDDPDVEAHIINVSGTGVKAPEYKERGLDVIDAAHSKKALKTFRMGTVRSVRRILKDIRPDIIHTLQFSGDYFGRLASMGLGIPVITHIRNVKSEVRKMRIRFNKILSYRTDLYLSVSKAAVETIQREHNVAKRDVQVLYNAVDPVKLDVSPHDLREMYGLSGKVIIGVGRFVAQKNFDLVLQAFAKVIRNHDASLVLVGEGGERKRLEGLIKALGLEGRAVLTGYRRDVPNFLRAADVLVMPSDYEGLPVTHVEALFSGLPAVISRYVPSIEIAADSSLVCRRDPDDIAGKISTLLEDEDLYERMSKAAFEAAPEYSMDNYVDKLKTVYRDLLARRGK